MGSGASVEGTLPSAADVEAAVLDDHFRRVMRRNEEVLERERKLCEVSGYEAAAFYAQPLMKAKLDCSLSCLDDLAEAYSADQQRRQGYSEAFLEELASSGGVTSMCVLKDKATLACATDNGPLWIYNWREGQVVSSMRQKDRDGPMWGGGQREGSVQCLCSASEDHRLLASGDDRGYVAIWDLSGPSLAMEARLHEKSVTDMKCDMLRKRLVTTSEDCYIITYDVEGQQVLDRAVPATLTCGSGVPNTCLELGGDRQRNMVLVGGADGKLRIWNSDSGTLKRTHTILMGAVYPTKCLLAPNGYHLLVTASLGDSAFCGARPERGGLYVYDLRRIGDGSESPLIAKYLSRTKGHESLSREGSRGTSLRSYRSQNQKTSIVSGLSSGVNKLIQGTGIGAVDMALGEEKGHMIAMCLMDNVVRTFDLDAPLQHPTRGTQIWEHDIKAKFEPEWAHPCAIASCDRYVFVACSSPSLGIWRRPPPTSYGHHDYEQRKSPPAPLELRSRCGPLGEPTENFPDEVLVADPVLRPGDALNAVCLALEQDRQRIATSIEDRMKKVSLRQALDRLDWPSGPTLIAG